MGHFKAANEIPEEWFKSIDTFYDDIGLSKAYNKFLAEHLKNAVTDNTTPNPLFVECVTSFMAAMRYLPDKDTEFFKKAVKMAAKLKENLKL